MNKETEEKYKQENEQIVNAMIGKKSYLEMVAEFHKAMGVPIRNNPNLFSRDEFELRINLLAEELDEMRGSFALRDAVIDGDSDKDWKEPLLDALCDFQYVLLGAVLHLGFKGVFDDAFQAVHESNMTKIIKDKHSVELELFEYKKKGIPCRAEQSQYGWVIKRSSDGKVLKPSGYTPVKLKKFILG